MRTLFADAINFPLVIVFGGIVLIPLLAFEVFVEAFVLKSMWGLDYRGLCKLTLAANLLSMLAGLPAGLLNSVVDGRLLPGDIPGYFARYPTAAAVDSVVYFIVTLAVEGFYARGWLRRHQIAISRQLFWSGVLVSNMASYAVVAPLNYLATRPSANGLSFATDTRWTAHPTQRLLFIDAQSQFLKSIRMDGSDAKTIIAAPVADFLISSNFEVCLFRGTNDSFYLYRQSHPTPELLRADHEKFLISEVSFSPSGKRVAFASRFEGELRLYDVTTATRTVLPLAPQGISNDLSVAWSSDEGKLFVRGENNRAIAVSISSAGQMAAAPLRTTNDLPVYRCFGRFDGSVYNFDTCGVLSATTWPGLDSCLMIRREDSQASPSLLRFSVRPGYLHLAGFNFEEVAFLDGCNECLFQANDGTYLLDIGAKRVGTLAFGSAFILPTPRYLKAF